MPSESHELPANVNQYKEPELERASHSALFGRAPVPYVFTDGRGVITKVNPAAVALLRVRAERLIGRPISAVVQDSSRPRLRRIIDECRSASSSAITTSIHVVPRGRSPVRMEATVAAGREAKTGELELTWLLVDHKQRTRRAIVRREREVEVERGVRRRMAAFEETQQRKDQLLATVSHEFRTALGAIGGYTELLVIGLRGPLNEEQTADLERIYSAYQHLAHLVDDLLSFTKVIAGQIPLELDTVSVSDTLRGVTDLVAPQAAAAGVSIVTTTDEAHVLVFTDPERVRQIVVNLLANAVKFSSRGAAITLNAECRDMSILINVTDTGPGIPDEKLRVIFEPFVRLSSTARVPGTGLGLAISKEVARAIGGDLTVTSELGRGTCFTLTLPIGRRARSSAEERASVGPR